MIQPFTGKRKPRFGKKKVQRNMLQYKNIYNNSKVGKIILKIYIIYIIVLL